MPVQVATKGPPACSHSAFLSTSEPQKIFKLFGRRFHLQNQEGSRESTPFIYANARDDEILNPRVPALVGWTLLRRSVQQRRCQSGAGSCNCGRGWGWFRASQDSSCCVSFFCKIGSLDFMAQGGSFTCFAENSIHSRMYECTSVRSAFSFTRLFSVSKRAVSQRYSSEKRYLYMRMVSPSW